MSALNNPGSAAEILRSMPASGHADTIRVPALSLRPSQAILAATLVVGVLDAADGVIAFYIAAGMTPIQVLQYIASGLLGASSFTGGLASAALGAAIHFFIAFVVAGVYILVSRRIAALARRPALWGAAYGAAVYLFMNFVVLPFSAVPPSPPSLGLLLNGLIGHALFVGLPTAFAAQLTGMGGRR